LLNIKGIRHPVDDGEKVLTSITVALSTQRRGAGLGIASIAPDLKWSEA